jgi:hypothetical protein
MPRKDKTRGPSQRAFGGNRKTHSYSDESFNALEFSQILPALFCVILACAVYTLVSALTRVAQKSRWPCPSHPLFAGFFQCRLSFCQWPLLTSDRSLHSQRVTLCLIISGSVVSRSLSWKFVSSGCPNTWSFGIFGIKILEVQNTTCWFRSAPRNLLRELTSTSSSPQIANRQSE